MMGINPQMGSEEMARFQAEALRQARAQQNVNPEKQPTVEVIDTTATEIVPRKQIESNQ